MKRISIIVMIVLWCLLCNGQRSSARIDSLYKELTEAEDHEKANLMLELGNEYLIQGRLAVSINYSKKALFYGERHNQNEMIAAANYQLGDIYIQLDDVASAQNHFIKCYNLSLKHKYHTLLVYSSAGLGNVYIKTQDRTSALKYINNALHVAEKHKLKNDIPKFNNLIGIVHLNNNQYDSAMLYFQKLLDAGFALKDSILIGCAYNNMADANIKKGKYAEAIALLDLSYKINKVHSQQRAVASILSNKGESYLKLGKYEEALKFLMESNTIAKKRGFLETQMTTYKNLSELYDKTGHCQLSLDYYKMYTTCKDSIFNIEKQKQISNLNIRNQQEQAEKQLKVLEEKAMNRSLILYFTLFSALWIIILLIQSYRRFRLKIKLQEVEKTVMAGTIDEQYRELASLAMNLGQKKLFISQIEESVKNISNSYDNHKIEEFFNEISEKIRDDDYLDNNWAVFLKHFNSVHPLFFTKLQEKHPDLTTNDLKQCAFLKLKLGVKEVALINNITPNSVYMSRYRLKMKLNLDTDQDISTYINQFN